MSPQANTSKCYVVHICCVLLVKLIIGNDWGLLVKCCRPTLIELAGLPPCQENLGGQSFASEFAAGSLPSAAAPRYAFSTFPRCNCTYETDVIDVRNGTCSLGPYRGYPSHGGKGVTGGVGASNMHVCLETTALAFDWMGLSVRSDRWRYTLWMEWDGAALAPRWDRVVGEELYDHAGDDGLGGALIFDAFENLNLASRVANPHPTAVQLSAIKTLRLALKANEASDGAAALDTTSGVGDKQLHSRKTDDGGAAATMDGGGARTRFSGCCNASAFLENVIIGGESSMGPIIATHTAVDCCTRCQSNAACDCCECDVVHLHLNVSISVPGCQA